VIFSELFPLTLDAIKAANDGTACVASKWMSRPIVSPLSTEKKIVTTSKARAPDHAESDKQDEEEDSEMQDDEEESEQKDDAHANGTNTDQRISAFMIQAWDLV
jgi:hypothetical protein